MLTGPVTILQWSFVRDDQPRARDLRADRAGDPRRGARPRGGRHRRRSRSTSRRCARACRCARRRRTSTCDWAVDCFRLATAGVARRDPDPHPHVLLGVRRHHRRTSRAWTPTCISIEASRSRHGAARRLRRRSATRTTSARASTTSTRRACPSVEEIEHLLERAESRIGRERLWVNPDCGLKTRGWDEVLPALEHMVAATRPSPRGQPRAGVAGPTRSRGGRAARRRPRQSRRTRTSRSRWTCVPSSRSSSRRARRCRSP